MTRGRFEFFDLTLGSRGHLVQVIHFADGLRSNSQDLERKKVTEFFLYEYNSHRFNFYKKKNQCSGGKINKGHK